MTDIAECPNRISKPGFVPMPNGCGTVDHRLPDHFGKCDFTPACNTHDICYVSCPNPKQSCDDKFISDINESCISTYKRPLEAVDRYGCRKLSTIAARVAFATEAAQRAYEAAQKLGCQCCL
jgi:hypothetical protein